ncbi:phosphoribosylformylglycinamidine synthase subunit I [Anaerobranca californiensis DSM 14826]|jgi:phosphoribosylformylglycinamidine synthase|uniref:Phosphoribosylformylglycinamidine synthase subunit PurQ n=1 Tax=Anaerobranca californiensis DSM 14826 TaxID=1120989 RepID=A0A1M6PWZ3_9FIRM|nr:phosphoribosylformylglycinamidine synthase subunit PurQ [Anaerobranca californiensis]SHK12396.1 phosphoribosylformylglycinamidine synthase subunit I [Anaerobranca californiensis DSM 14826]
MKFGVVLFPGSNCDKDAEYAVNFLGQSCEMLWHKEKNFKGIDCIILPGGFSYGDYLRAGAIARFAPIMERVVEFAQKGGLVMGICNGFQILTEVGLLPGVLIRNKNLRFVCDIVPIRVENTEVPYTYNLKKGDILKLPIAHGEGNYYIDNKGLEELKKNNQIVFSYLDNPNGSVENIAGIVNIKGNVLGMMPHPERGVEKVLGSEDGMKILKSVINWWGEKNGKL